MAGRNEERVVFFDGECGLCDRFVRQLIKRDKFHRLKFAALQGDTAQARFGKETESAENWSIVYTEGSDRYQRSEAALRAIAALGGPWKAALGLRVFPRAVRDGVYRWVATHRYRWFGKLDACLLPTPALKERFLP
jgi:predicted DCC family thiol-disulfide oxidoreductase YuxK